MENVRTLSEFWWCILIDEQGHHGHDTHALPPNAICDAYKKYQRMDDASVDSDFEIVDFSRGLTSVQKERIFPVDAVSSELIDSARKAFDNFQKSANEEVDDTEEKADACTIYEHKDFDGNTSLHPPRSGQLTTDCLVRAQTVSIPPPTRLSSFPS